MKEVHKLTYIYVCFEVYYRHLRVASALQSGRRFHLLICWAPCTLVSCQHVDHARGIFE